MLNLTTPGPLDVTLDDLIGMRILTVKQPYAWGIVHGGKDVENRTRNLAGGYRGLVAIHAGLGWATHGATDRNVIGAVMHANQLDAPIIEANGYVEVDQEEFAPRGAIIGVANLVEVHHAVDGRNERHCSPWAMDGNWHLILHDRRPLKTPIPYKGGLGLRTITQPAT